VAIESEPDATSLRNFAPRSASRSSTMSICCLTGAKSQLALAARSTSEPISAPVIRIPESRRRSTSYRGIGIRNGGQRDKTAREAAPRRPPGNVSLVEQGEGPERLAKRDVDEVGIAGALCVDAADAAHHRHVLLAVHFPGDRLSDNSGRSLEAPE